MDLLRYFGPILRLRGDISIKGEVVLGQELYAQVKASNLRRAVEYLFTISL